MLDSQHERLKRVHGRPDIDMGGITVDRDSRFVFGEGNWLSYELRFRLRFLEGANAQIRLRQSVDEAQFYVVDFLFGWQALGVSRVDSRPGGRGLQKLSVVNLEMSRRQELDVEVAIRELSITTYVDGESINQVTDETLRAGPMAFCAWESKVRFGEPEFRVLA